MQKMMIASVLALAGLGLAGSVAADNGDDCTYGASPVPGGFYNLCVFEENGNSYSWNYCSWSSCYEGSSTWSENRLAGGYLWQSAGPVAVSADANVYQYESSGWQRWTDSFGSGSSTWDYAGTAAYAGSYLGTPFGGTSGAVSASQWDNAYQGCDSWGCYSYQNEGTGIGTYRYMGPLYLDAGYQQSSYNGGACQEQAYLYTSFGGSSTPAQACAAEIPQLMADPNTQFPDWPDGTGLPFL